jgi:hypothetical protein
MKKIFLFIVLSALLSARFAEAQNTLGKTEDLGRISLTPVVSDEITALPAEARSFLVNKLQQIATMNGLGGKMHNPWFVITANVALLSKDIVAGPPQMIAQNIEVTFYIADYRQKIMLSTAALSIKGVGTNETKAIIDAIKNIKVTNPELKMFVETGKNSIIEYYNSHCDFILADADAKNSQKLYREAIFTLTAVPDVCKDCYMKANKAVGPVYKRYVDFQCKVLLHQAQTDWMSSQNSTGAEIAGHSLTLIDPEAECYGEARQFMAQVAQKVLEDEKRDIAFVMKIHDDNIDLERRWIEAARAIGVAYGENQPQQVYNFRGWLW